MEDHRKNDNQIIGFLMEMKEDLGFLKGEADKTNTHLANLNGRVVTHTEQISTIKQDLGGVKTKIAIYSSLAGGVITMGWQFIKSKIGI